MDDDREIERKDFTVSLRGYDREEVDAYLSDLGQEIRALRLQIGQQPAPAKAPDTSPAATYRQIGEETSRILVAADDAAREIRGRAEREAASVVSEARTKAEELSRRTQRELKDAEDQIVKLREARDTLATQLEDVGRRLQETMSRLRTPMETGAESRGPAPMRREPPAQREAPAAPTPEPTRESPRESPRETQRETPPSPQPRAATRTPPRPTPIPPRQTPSARADTKAPARPERPPAPAPEPIKIPPRETEPSTPKDELVPEPPKPPTPEAKVAEAPPTPREEPSRPPVQEARAPAPEAATAPPREAPTAPSREARPAPSREAPPAPASAAPPSSAPESQAPPVTEAKAQPAATPAAEPTTDAVTASATAALEQLLEEVRRDREEGQREVQAAISTLTEEKTTPTVERVDVGDAEDILSKRENAIGPAPSTAARRLKRLLQEDQNYLLDRLRTHKGKGSFDESIAPSDVQLERFQEGMQQVLEESFISGRHFGGAADAGESARPVADLVSKQIVAPLRRDLSRIVDSGLAAGDTVKSIAERVSDVFRVWKGIRTELLGEGLVYAAYHQGLVDALRQRDVGNKRWVRSPNEHDCPRGVCDSNADAGAIALSTPFPSGHLTPPAHGGCTCALAEG